MNDPKVFEMSLDRLRRPLRAYGILEAAIGVYCLVTPLLFEAADAQHLAVHRQELRAALRARPAGDARCEC